MAAAGRFGTHRSGFRKPDQTKLQQPTPRTEPGAFFYLKKKVPLHFLGFLCWDFFSPCPWRALLPQVWTTPGRLSWSSDPLLPLPCRPWPEQTAATVGSSRGGLVRLRAGGGRVLGDQGNSWVHFGVGTPSFWLLPSNSRPSHGAGMGPPLAFWDLVWTFQHPETQKVLCGKEFWKSPHLRNPRKAISTRESWPHVQPRAPTPASPRLPPCSNWPTPGVLMWGTQALSKVCLHLACFAAVAHWGGDRPCDVRNVNGSQVCTACLPPAPLASIPLHPSLWGPGLLSP